MLGPHSVVDSHVAPAAVPDSTPGGIVPIHQDVQYGDTHISDGHTQTAPAEGVIVEHASVAVVDVPADPMDSGTASYEKGSRRLAGLARRLGTRMLSRWAHRPEQMPDWNPEGYVEDARPFAEQVSDLSLRGPVAYVAGEQSALGVSTHAGEQVVTSEHEMLTGLRDFLDTAKQQCTPDLQAQAAAMQESLTFIDTRSYERAARGIAGKWRDMLLADPQLELCVISDRTDKGMVKSSQYLLEKVLSNFTDDELQAFKGRLLDDPKHLTAQAQNARIVLLDDWVISGKQMRHVIHGLQRDYPDYRDAIEVQLVAAGADHLSHGLSLSENIADVSGDGPSVPVSAFYRARQVDRKLAPWNGALITGSHCSADIGFNDELAKMCKDLGPGVSMPPGANIVRPYRASGFSLTQRRRLMDRAGRQLYAPIDFAELFR